MVNCPVWTLSRAGGDRGLGGSSGEWAGKVRSARHKATSNYGVRGA